MAVHPYPGHGQLGHELRALLRDLARRVVVLLPSNQRRAGHPEPETGALVPRDAVLGEGLILW